MKFLRGILDRQARHFEKGGKLEKLYPLWEANDTFLYTPGTVTKAGSHVRDGLDLKRMMTIVVVALVPCIFMALYNTGLQALLQISTGNAVAAEGWRTALMGVLGLAMNPASSISCLVLGLLYYLPVLIVTFTVGGGIEVVFSIIRKHEVNEGFLVTGMLFPLICPPTIPLWQVALGIAFGVVIGKEVFGGTGMNIFNPALTARAFLFFAYPAEISGDKVWYAVNADGFSGPTILGQAAEAGMAGVNAATTWMDAFLGMIPGCMGETSAIACLVGAALLVLTRVASWRTMLGVVVGTVLTSLLLNAVAGKVNNPMFAMPFWWHMVLGGWAFGAVFMATDPVSSTFTDRGRLIYGFGIGVLAILVRVLNPAYPEGMMLAILLMNVFASTIDHVILQGYIKRRIARNAKAA